jgi:hypothetical protein
MAQQLSSRLTAATTRPLVVIGASFKGHPIIVSDTIEVADGAAADSAILAIEVPVDAVIHSVKVASDDLGAGTTMSVGLYKQDGVAASFTAVSGTAFATALDVATAAVALTEVRFSAKDINTINQKAWELAGLSAKPAYPTLFLGVAFPAETTAAGTVTASVQYSATAV